MTGNGDEVFGLAANNSKDGIMGAVFRLDEAPSTGDVTAHQSVSFRHYAPYDPHGAHAIYAQGELWFRELYP